MKRNINVILILFIGLVSISIQVRAQNKTSEISEILERFARDYENDVTFKKDITFGVKVNDDFWTIEATTGTDKSRSKVTFKEGKPSIPTFFFFTDFETLNKIDKGQLNALTGGAKAFSTDKAPFDVDVMPGFQPNQHFMETLLSIYFHFWTRGTPEVIPFGLEYTRFTHGAQASVFYYQPGFRSAYVALKKGQHANKDENSQENPFPTLLITIKGQVTAIINGNESIVKAGEAILIPPGVSHEFINRDSDEPVEAILLMFGEGA